jgi:hypothetical protein
MEREWKFGSDDSVYNQFLLRSMERMRHELRTSRTFFSGAKMTIFWTSHLCQ